MKLLLTSSGITNPTIENALTDLLGKPIGESRALVVPMGVYPFPGGAYHAWNPLAGKFASRLCQLGWKAMGLLEPSVLPSIDRANWLPDVEEADALLVWGGDPLFISYWMEKSGLTEILPTLANDRVYVGVSAGAIATAAIFGETYSNPRGGAGQPLTSDKIVLPDGDIKTTFVTAKGLGLAEFGVIPHFENPAFRESSRINAETWAARLPVPVYAIDEETAIKVDNGAVEVVSEGQWKLFNA